MRIKYEEMKQEFERILIKKGFAQDRANLAAKMFADTSLDGVYSHGYQRFPRVIEYIEKGYLDVNALPEKTAGMAAVERWDGHLGMGNLNAFMAMGRAIKLAEEHGIGLVAMANTNHWMRGGTYAGLGGCRIKNRKQSFCDGSAGKRWKSYSSGYGYGTVFLWKAFCL